MFDRTTRLLSLIAASIAGLIIAYCALLYSAAVKADMAQDRRTGILLQGETEKHARSVWEAMDGLAKSDGNFRAVETRDEAAMAKAFCGKAGEDSVLGTLGVMTAEGDPVFLCEGSTVKVVAEHAYLFDIVRGMAGNAFASTLEAQRKYGTIFPEFAFREKYVTIAERPYLLVAALAAPHNRQSLTADYQPYLVFGLSSMRGALADLEARLDIKDLRFSDGAAIAGLNHSALLSGIQNDTEIGVSWQPSHDFRDQLVRALPMVLGLTLLVFACILYFLKRVAGLQAVLVARESEMRHMALHDSLTGLPNRAHFLARASAAIAASKPDKPVYIGIFDLDRFKMVNDSFGHDVGDRLIIETAKRAVESLGPGNVLARLGGDEYALIVSTARSDADALDCLEDLGAALARPLVCGEHTLLPSASIGAARVSGSGVLVDDVLKEADTALYEVKANGRGHCRLFKERRSGAGELQARAGSAPAA